MAAVQEKVKCWHCQQQIQVLSQDKDGRSFCCTGCMSVYHIIKQNNLESFYKYRQDSGETPWNIPEYREENFHYLDSQQIHQDFIPDKDGTKSLVFYLEGIHCIACLWLIEKLPKLVPGVSYSKVNLAKSTVKVHIMKGGSFSQVANMLVKMGYFPHPIFKENELEEIRVRDERSHLTKMAVAAACAMNIMLFAISIYGGATGLLATYFGYFCLLLAIPVVTYSAWPFYHSAIAAIRTRHINIDVPLSIAIILGFIVSAINVFNNSDVHYFDSITTLTFLILFSRYLLKKVQQNSLSINTLSDFFNRGDIRKIEDGHEISIHKKYLEVGDLIKVLPGDMIPVDGIIAEGSSSLNTSTLTGESNSVEVSTGDQVFAGTENIDRTLFIRVKAMNNSTRMGSIFDKIERLHQNQAPILRLTDQFSRYFLAFMLLLAVGTFSYFSIVHSIELALLRTLSLIIITCPCALGLAIPLTFSRAVSNGSKAGIIIKNEAVLEEINRCKYLYLDKTGTLTHGKYVVEQIEYLSSSLNRNETEEIIFALERYSKHPLAKAIRKYLLKNNLDTDIKLKKYREILGQGVSALINGKNYSITGVDQNSHKYSIQLGLFENDILISRITLNDRTRDDSRNWIHKIKKSGITPFILTGDRIPHAYQVAEEVGIDHDHVHAEMGPEQKAKIISNNDSSIMVGDGANDTLALKLAKVGVAVQGSIDVGLKVSDVYFSTPGIEGIHKLINLGKRTLRTVHSILFFTAFYNIAGAILAIKGNIGPLQAAILMPLSSLIVIGISLYGTRGKRS